MPIIRSSSPSSPNNGGRESQLPQLIKVNQNFSLGRRPVSIAETNANSVRLERQRLQLENDQQLEDEIVLRERYFQYWAQQQVGNHKLFLITVKLGDKERFDKEKIGVKEHFPVTNC